MAEATGGDALDRILGGLETFGLIWGADRVATLKEKQLEREREKAKEARFFPYGDIGGLFSSSGSEPMSPQVMAAYAAVAVAIVAVLGFAIKMFRG